MVAEQKPQQDAAQALDFLRIITEGWDDLPEPASLELRCLFPGRSPSVSRYSPDESGFEMLLEHATAMNQSGLNVYPVINPVRASAPLRRDGKLSGAQDEDIIGSFFFWADADDEAATYAIKNFAGPKFTMSVTTGRIPFVRPHVYWRIEDGLIQNLELWSDIQRGIAAQLSTDKAVINPARIMRLPGMINWPTDQKAAKGRIPEVATLRTDFPEDRDPVPFERMRRIFEDAGKASRTKTGNSGGNFDFDPGGDHRTADDYADILRRARTDGEKHGGVRDLAASLAGAGVPLSMARAIVRDACPVWDDGVEKLISSAYAKFYKQPEQPFAAASGDDDEAAPSWPTPLTDFNELTLPRREWIYGTDYIRKYVSVVASAGGIGKTSQAIAEALAIITNKPLLGVAVKESCNVWVVNLEDPIDELKMRTLAAMKHYGIAQDAVRGRLFLDGEDTIQITLAMEGRNGLQMNDDLLEAMRAKIVENKIGVVIIDPFVSTHLVNENSNASIQAVVAMLRGLARKTKASISLVHHTRKGNGEDAGVDSVRGAGSLIGAARAVRVINRLSEADAARLGIDAKEARSIFRVDDGKANLAPPAESAVYRKMIGVQLANDEWVGVTTVYELPDEWAGMSEAVINEMLRQIEAGPARDDDSEEYFSLRPQDKARWVGKVITDYPFKKAEDFKSEAQAKQIIRQWLQSGLLEEVEYYSASQRKNRKGVTATGRVGEQK